MRRAIIYAALLAEVVLLSPTDGNAQRSPPLIAAAAKPPKVEGWTVRAHQLPQVPTRPGVIVSEIGAPGEAPSTVGEDIPKVAEVTKEDDHDIQALINEDGFLLPVWYRGFWAMPPGGMTRFLRQPPHPINPDTKLVAHPMILILGCPSLP
jgi:hypothetical protein